MKREGKGEKGGRGQEEPESGGKARNGREGKGAEREKGEKGGGNQERGGHSRRKKDTTSERTGVVKRGKKQP